MKAQTEHYAGIEYPDFYGGKGRVALFDKLLASGVVDEIKYWIPPKYSEEYLRNCEEIPADHDAFDYNKTRVYLSLRGVSLGYLTSLGDGNYRYHGNDAAVLKHCQLTYFKDRS